MSFIDQCQFLCSSGFRQVGCCYAKGSLACLDSTLLARLLIEQFSGILGSLFILHITNQREEHSDFSHMGPPPGTPRFVLDYLWW